jgi:hypothetical protein
MRQNLDPLLCHPFANLKLRIGYSVFYAPSFKINSRYGRIPCGEFTPFAVFYNLWNLFNGGCRRILNM